MATLSFFAGNDFTINNLSGSGLGLYSDTGFGGSVLVGEYNGRTFITNSAGTTQGSEVDNIKYNNAQSGIIGQVGSGINILAIPNYQATMKIQFSHASAVTVQNTKIRAYDRSSINNVPSGVLVKIAELIHPWTTQTPLGSGDNQWIGSSANPQTGTLTVGGSGLTVTLANSPGISGDHAGDGSNSTWSDTTHEWFVAISASPSTIGSKLFALYVELEYL